MPTVSGRQYRLMAGIAHGMKPRSGIGPSPDVAKEMVAKTPSKKRSLFMKAMKKHKAVYFAATGGAGALLGKRVKKAQVVAYEDLGPEAIRRLEVEDLPVIVINDVYGNDLYIEGEKKYRTSP